MTPVRIFAGRPLTSMQTSMVLATLRDPQSGAYIVQDICETPELLDLARLRRAWHAVAARHIALRTRVEAGPEGRLEQCASEAGEIPWSELDWTGLDAETARDRLAGFLREDRARGFDFARGVPMRMTLIRIPGNVSVLVWTSHHVLLDGQSYARVWREWFAIYDAAEILDRQPISFDTYLDWLDTRNFSAAEQFWRQHLAGVSRTTGFIVDRMGGAASPHGASVDRETVVLSQEVTDAIRSFARHYGLTVATLVQCAWALLLSRYGGTPDVVFGITHACRSSGAPGAETIVGPLINTLPFRMVASSATRVLPWLRQVREELLAMRAHEHTPIARIRDWNLLPVGAPPFDTLLIYDYERLGETLRKLGGQWAHRSVSVVQGTDSPLTLTAVGSPRLSMTVVYDTRVYSRYTVAGMAGHVQTLIESLISQPDSRLAELNMLTAQERRWLIEERNQTAVARRPDLCGHELFERETERRPTATAMEHAGASITFEQLNRRANQLAGLLRERGAGPEDYVGVCMGRSPDAVMALLAVLKAGAAFVLLPADLPSARLANMLEDIRPKLVISGEAMSAGCGCEVLSLDRCESELTRQSGANLECLAGPENAAYAAFTSGSTGRPKAAVITHRSLANHTTAVARVYGISSADRRLQFAAIGSDMFVSEVFTYLCAGAALIFCMDSAGNSIAEFLRLAGAHRITIAGMPASWWSGWAAAVADAPAPPCLRAVILGMERLNPTALAAFRRATGDTLRLFNAYGPTETGPTSTIYEAGSSPWESASLVPIGTPIDNARVYVLDDDGNPVPVGVAGELYIAGDGVARGYLNAPELTASKFQADTYSGSPAERMFRTGDRVFSLPDGNLVFLGRADRQVKIRGFRVEPEEIEAALAEHPGVRQCAVVAQEDDGRASLAAYLTVGEVAPSSEDLRLHLLRRLPDYMIPAHFAILPEMPVTASGKVDRLALPRIAGQVRLCEHTVEPATTTEKRLALLWQETLGIARVGATDSFFESGGDSLRATQLFLLIHREFGKDLPFALFLRGPTIAQIARVLDGEMATHSEQTVTNGAMLSYAHDGARLPLFCITSNATDLYVFRHLTNHLERAQPVFVLSMPMQEDGEERTVEELAADLRGSIRGIRPAGPYILGGYCFGGIVAFEVAQQLIAAGEEVPLVAFFDTPAPGYPRLLGSRQLAAGLRAAGRLIRGVPAPARVMAARKYVPRPIEAGLAQFMAGDQEVSTRLLKDPRLAWRELCRGRFQVYRVPGDHITWLIEPNAATAAARLSEALAMTASTRAASAARPARPWHSAVRRDPAR